MADSWMWGIYYYTYSPFHQFEGAGGRSGARYGRGGLR